MNELRPRRKSSSSEGDTAPTQTGNRNEEGMHTMVQGIEQEPQEKDGEEDEGFTTVVGKGLKWKMNRERSRSWSLQGTKSKRTYVPSDDEDACSGKWAECLLPMCERHGHSG